MQTLNNQKKKISSRYNKIIYPKKHKSAPDIGESRVKQKKKIKTQKYGEEI